MAAAFLGAAASHALASGSISGQVKDSGTSLGIPLAQVRGVNTVHVWAYPVDARGNRLDPIFIGPAIYGGARPDVAAVYGDRFGNSGYGIIVNGLPPGTYDITVFAYSTVVNAFTAASVVRISVR